MIFAHRIQLDLTHKQQTYCAQAAGTSRFVWNWALAEWNRQYAAREKPTSAKLKLQFNAIKYTQFPWLENIARDAHSQPFANLGSAFQKFFKKKAKRPKFKCRGKCRDSFYVANDKLQVKGQRVRLPVIGWAKLTESLRFVGKIMSATVSRQADKWFISISVEVGDYQKPRNYDAVIGVDLGIKQLAVTSAGQVFDSPMPLRANLKKLARLQRSHSRKKKGSKNREKARLKVAKLYAKITNIRQDCLHKLTTDLCKNHAVVAIEDLCVKGMLRNRCLSKAISDVGFAELRRQLDYKAKIYNTKIVVIDRFFPSSKTCSGCGNIKSDLTLSDRDYACSVCGLEIDRDFNASFNIKTAGLAGLDCGPEGAGCGCKSAVKPRRDEAGTKPCALVHTN